MQVAASNMLATRRKLPGRFWAVRESNLYNQMSGMSSGALVEVWGVWVHGQGESHPCVCVGVCVWVVGGVWDARESFVGYGSTVWSG